MTFSTNQILVAGLILALLVMAGALVAMAVRAIKLMKFAETEIDETKAIITYIQDMVSEAKGLVEDKIDSVNHVATGVAGGIMAARIISKLSIFNWITGALDRRNAKRLKKEAKEVNKATKKVLKANKRAKKAAKEADKIK